MKEIIIPKKLALFVKAFSADEQSAKTLIVEAAKTICKSENSIGFGDEEISNEELEGIIAIMKGIKPRDIMEMIYGAQIITSHLLGLRLLSHSFSIDQVLGLKLLKFSNEAMNQLQKKRAGEINQNNTVSYNYNGQSSALMQKDESCQ